MELSKKQRFFNFHAVFHVNMKCPYCNQKIEFDVEIEDYLLKPVIDRWTTFQKYSSDGSALLDL